MTGSASCAPEPPAAPATLEGRLEAELAAPPGPAGEAAARVAAALRERHGDALAAVLFYGSCLRRGTDAGVLDVYALVDRWRGAYASRRLAWLGAALPPNVHYLELPASRSGASPLRAKVAVMRVSEFAAAAAGSGIDTRIWARFCQPSRLVFARDEAARRAVADAVARATRTAGARMLDARPGEGEVLRMRPESLFEEGFRETYRAEFRSERDDTIRALVADDAPRYAAVARAVLRELAEDGRLRLREEEDAVVVLRDAAVRRRGLRRWRRQRRLSKARTALALLKTTATFDDWVSYVVFKLERHGGEPVALSERQRRHPFLLGGPVLVRLLRRRILR
jgi:hypothetical protein